MQAQKVLEMLGYSAKEAKVYLAMLSLGETHISDIADKVKMPRSSTQTIVDRLYKDGLVNYYIMRRYKYWVAENPNHLLDILRHREQAIQDALPNLIALRKIRQGKRFKKKSSVLSAFRLLADTIRQPVLITNDHSEIIYVNRLWEEEFGYLYEEVAGENPRILQSGTTSKDLYRDAWRHLKEGRMFQTGAMIDRRKDGTTFSFATTIFPVYTNRGMHYVQIIDKSHR